MSGHSRDVKKVSVARAGRLQECKNTEFVWEMRKTGFCEGGRVDGRVKYLGLPVQARGL